MPSYTSRDLTVSLHSFGDAMAVTEQPDEDKDKCGSCTDCTNRTGNNVFADATERDLGTLRIHLREALG